MADTESGSSPSSASSAAPAGDGGMAEAAAAIDAADVQIEQAPTIEPTAPEEGAVDGDAPAPEPAASTDAEPSAAASAESKIEFTPDPIDVPALIAQLNKFTSGSAPAPGTQPATGQAPAAPDADALPELTAEQEAAFASDFGSESAKPVLATIKGLRERVTALQNEQKSAREARAQEQAQAQTRRVHEWFDGQVKAGHGDHFGLSAEKASPEQRSARVEAWQLAGAIYGAFEKSGKPISEEQALAHAVALVTHTMKPPEAVQAVREQVRARHNARTLPSTRSGGQPLNPHANAAREIEQAQEQLRAHLRP